MSQHNKKNVAHSIFQQLLNRARIKKEDFNLLFSRYGMERFLSPVIESLKMELPFETEWLADQGWITRS